MLQNFLVKAMGGGGGGIESVKPDSGGEGGGGGGGGNGNGGSMLFVVCCKGSVKIVKESEIGDCQELTEPFDSYQEAEEWITINFPDWIC